MANAEPAREPANSRTTITDVMFATKITKLQQALGILAVQTVAKILTAEEARSGSAGHNAERMPSIF
jgi:ribosomal protein S8